MSKLISTILFDNEEVGSIFIDDAEPDKLQITGNIPQRIFPASYQYIDKNRKEDTVHWNVDPRKYVIYFHQYMSGDYWRASKPKVE